MIIYCVVEVKPMYYLNKKLTKQLGLKESEVDYLVWLRIKEELHGNLRVHY